MAGKFYVGKEFATYEELMNVVQQYEKDTNSLFVILTSKKVEAVNKLVVARGGVTYPPELKYYSLHLTCKRGGRVRIKTGDGTREYQGTWKCNCPAVMRFTATRSSLKMVEFCDRHENHETTAEEKECYPEIRNQIPDKEVEDKVNLLLKTKVKPSKIRNMFKDVNAGPLDPRDLANRRAKLKKQKNKGRSEEELLCDLLAQIQEADPGAFINVVKDEDTNELQNLFIQTSSMRNVMNQYGHVLLFDHTYKINANRMPTALMMTMDGNGDGRVVGIAFLANERKENVRHTLNGFVASCGAEVIAKVKTIVVDKDMSEIASIKVAMPHVNIQLCDFHVENVFNGRVAHEHPEIRGLLKKLRYAETDKEFQDLVLKVKALSSDKFWKYFETNWLNCPLAWAYRDKKGSLNLGNPTNNRLESFNGKVKIILDPHNTLAEALEGILGLVKQKEVP